jgi:D-alanine-D-alanine ligase
MSDATVTSRAMSRVLLLYGGRSAEHEVSCTSAVAVREALDEDGHQVIAVGIDRAGAWHLGDQTRNPLTAEGRPVSITVPDGSLRAGDDEIGFDVVFPVLHGPYGEDGTIQGLLDMIGVPYAGCGVLSSAVAMEKDIAKRLFESGGIATVEWKVVRRRDMHDPDGVVAGIVDSLGLPAFVKPAELGSSVGVSRVTTRAELRVGIDDALRYGDKAIVEEAIRGREIEVAVLEGPRVSVPGEIVLQAAWYDYDAKYRDDTSRFETPAALTEPQIREVQDLAARAFELLECRGLARVDFLFEERGRGFLLNEVNTMPGFTPISGFPKMWLASGMTYGRLCDELVQLALANA